MNKQFLNPKATFELRVSEINKLNDLIARDEAMAVIDDNDGVWYKCPACKKLAGKYENKSEQFCRYCGQRFDTGNTTL